MHAIFIPVNSDNAKYVLREFAERPLPNGHMRELVLPTDSGKVVGLSGVRRCGKTFLFFEAMRQLLARGVPRHRVLYLNFEDDRLHPIAATELDMVLRCQRELFPDARTGRLYLFLDEVQSAPGWQRWVRRLHDTEDISIFVTGSSSEVLTRDLSTAMRGRSITLDVFPLSFREFLAFRGIAVRDHDAASENEVRGALTEYLRWGGFPEVVVAAPELRPLILDEYASLMLWRDLVERHAIRSENVMRALLRHCFRNTATLLSLTKLHRDLTSLGVDASKNTVYDYCAMLEESGLINLLPIHDASLRRQARNPRKLHVIDPGLATAFAARAERDLGRKLETVVFLQCRRRSRLWHYDLDDHEIDLCDAEGTTFVNSCWSLVDASTLEREAAAMDFARSSQPGANGVLLYHDALADIESRLPDTRPAWRWLLDQPGSSLAANRLSP